MSGYTSRHNMRYETKRCIICDEEFHSLAAAPAVCDNPACWRCPTCHTQEVQWDPHSQVVYCIHCDSTFDAQSFETLWIRGRQ